MKLVKAIEIQTIHNDHNPNYTDKDREDAHQLGIEAMEDVLESRGTLRPGLYPLLPGETED